METRKTGGTAQKWMKERGAGDQPDVKVRFNKCSFPAENGQTNFHDYTHGIRRRAADNAVGTGRKQRKGVPIISPWR